MLIAVIPDIFQRTQVVLNVRVLAVANEPPAGERWIWRFEINLVVRVYLLLDIEMEAVGVITFIRHPIHHAKLSGIQTAETVTQVFTRGAVEAKAVAGLLFPLIHRLAQTLYNRNAFGTQRFTVEHMLFAEQRVDGFVDADKAKRDRRTSVFENFRDVVVRFQSHAAGPFHIEDRCHTRFHPFQTGDTGHQRLTRQHQTFIQQFPERGFVAFGFQRDARQVQADDAQVVTPVVDLFAVLFVHAEEAAAAHWGFKRAGHFHDLIVVEDVRVHAFARALQRQLFDVVVRVIKLMVQAIFNGENQLREHGGFTVFTKTCDAVTQNRLLNQTRFPTGAKTKAEGDERGLAVGGVQRIDFIFQ